ncbi:MAG: NAD(P)/FAD-dependent oxidoreductase [Chloroflexota bacterium]|nr:NAD(P)/FAD-dependent oxidoreductase [Chloroflexota bacterium]
MAEYEVIVAGGGHNGLTAAAYLAKAGVNVCVLEKNDWVGGGVVTREVTLPGFKHDLGATAHIFVQPNPLILNDELGLLSKHGLRYLYPEPAITVLFPDDTYISFYKDIDKTCQSIAKISPKDAESYKRFYEFASGLFDLLMMGMFSPPPPMGALLGQLDQGGPPQELFRALLMNGLDVINEWFEDDRVKLSMLRFVSEAIVSPDDNGTGAFLFIMVPEIHRYGLGIPVGGSGELSESLARCIRANGGTVRTGAGVASVKVVGGQARGVILESGEEVTATKAVVCNLNIKQVFPGMVKGAEVDPDFLRKVHRLTQAPFLAMNCHYALNQAPNYKAGELVTKGGLVELTPWMDDFRFACGNYRLGYEDYSMPVAACNTVHDPTRAPEGKHSLYLMHYAPFVLKKGTWDERKEEIADKVLETIRQHTTNMGPENILARTVESPPDFEKWNASWPKGDATHIGSGLHQFMGNRPMAGWSQYRMPVERLYLCGPSTHPGLGAGAGARAAVQVVMEDLGVDFSKVIQ